jgi:hypothetical protein
MNPSPQPAVFIHDTRRIIEASDGACALFRAERWMLVDRDMLELLPDADFRALAKLRLYVLRGGKGSALHPQNYDFMRLDGSVFAAEVTTRGLDGGQYETTVTYRYEVR